MSYLQHIALWTFRVALAVLLVWGVYASEDIHRLPLSSAWIFALRVFWWQQILFLCCLIIGIKVLVSPEDPEVYSPSSTQYICLALSLGLARQMDWFYYFVAAATMAYYGHIEVPDTLILAWIIVVMFLLLLTQGNLCDELNMIFAAVQIYVSILAGNFWGIAMGFSMIFNYTRRLQLDLSGLLEIAATRVIVVGYLATIVLSIFFFHLMQDQSSIHLQDFLPLRIHSLRFFPAAY